MPNARATFDAFRALSALFLYRALHPVLFMIVIVLVACYALTIMLVLSFSSWWWLLLTILVPITLFLALLGYILWFLLQRMLPRTVSAVERRRLSSFVDKIFEVADKTKLPYPVLLVLIGKDIIRGKESRFLSGLIGDSKDLTKEFVEIQKLFEG